MSNIVTLSAAIVSVLQNVQQNGESAFADIEAYPTVQFSGTPAATVVPSDNTSDYATNVQNLRTYTFFVDLYYPLQVASAGGPSQAFAVMAVLVDTVIDAFDNSNTLNGACQILVPTPSSWQLVQSTSGELLNARINLSCKTTVITNNG